MSDSLPEKSALFVERRRNFDPALHGPARYYDEAFKAYAVKVGLADYAVTAAENDMLVTLLGSCVAACIRDPVAGVGGMNHFMLPGRAPAGWEENSHAARYGHYAMEKLINEVLKLGARRDRLEIKLFGGASIIKSTRISVGEENIRFVKGYLAAEGLPIASEDLGGFYPRRIHYFVKTGKIFRLLLRRSDDAGIFSRELEAREGLQPGALDGNIDLFS